MATALFVDDSEFMRALLKALVVSHDVEVVGEADNGKDAVKLYKELKPDLVFMDVMMDEMNGVEALTEIMEFNPNAKVVMVSSMMKQEPFVNDAIKIGAKAIINKPFDDDEVDDVLQDLLGR